jgi:hypothetical protein
LAALAMVTPQSGDGTTAYGMIRKSGNRFSEKIMLDQRDEIMMQFLVIAS